MRLIDADALRKEMYHMAFETDTDMQKWDGGCWIRYKMFENAIEDTPTVDAVEVVRCKDCDFYMEAPWGGDMMCYNGLAEGFEFTAPDDYCSRGRRRDGGEKDA